jgi:hypothetical protein
MAADSTRRVRAVNAAFCRVPTHEIHWLRAGTNHRPRPPIPAANTVVSTAQGRRSTVASRRNPATVSSPTDLCAIDVPDSTRSTRAARSPSFQRPRTSRTRAHLRVLRRVPRARRWVQRPLGLLVPRGKPLVRRPARQRWRNGTWRSPQRSGRACAARARRALGLRSLAPRRRGNSPSHIAPRPPRGARARQRWTLGVQPSIQ